MTRSLLFLLFFLLLGADMLDVNLSLGPGLSVKNAFIYLIFIIIAIETVIKGNRQFELKSVIIPYSLGFAYAAFSIALIVLLINYPNYWLRSSIISLKGGFADNLLLLLIFFYGVMTTKHALTLIKLMLWTVILANAVTIIDTFDIPDLDLILERQDGRIGGPIGESNQYAVFLVLFLPATIALVLVERGFMRLFAVIGLAISLLALLLTGSRGGFVGIIMGSIVGAVFLREFLSAKAVVSAISAVAILAVAGVVLLFATGYGDMLYERTIGLSQTGSSFDVSSGRDYIWATALLKMFSQPWTIFTGYGWDTWFQLRYLTFAPHNSYLGVFFELGAIGLGLILISIANVLRTARTALRHTEGAASTMLLAFVFGLISLLIAIFFVDISSVWLFVWSFVGASMRLAIVPELAESPAVAKPARFMRPDHRLRSS